MLKPTTQLLTVSEAAKLTHMSNDAVRRWCRLGFLPAVRVGKTGPWRIRIEDLVRYIDSGPKLD